MPNALPALTKHLQEIWRHFGRVQKLNTLVGLLIAVGVVVGLLFWSAKPDYRLLYSGLSLKDAAAIRERLDDEKIPLQLQEGGRAVHVKAEDLYRARLLLAASGLPEDKSAGFEMFESPKFGLTDFAQRVNYQRALQGELERTIMAMDGIKSARIMLVLPKERLLATEEEKQSRASILLTLQAGRTLEAGQIQSIVQLVSGSVQNLDPSSITVTDQNGRLLNRGGGESDEPYELTDSQLAVKEKTEKMLTRKAQDMLDTALGLGKSLVKVNVHLNFDKVEKRSENYNKTGRVAQSEQIESESSSSPAGSRGKVAGVVANIPVRNPGSGAAEQGMSTMKKENIKSDYLVPNEVAHVIERGGRLVNLSVSVAVAQGEAPRAAEDLKKISDMVKGAVGFTDDSLRKDSIDVVEMPFATLAREAPGPWYTRFPFGLDSIGQWGIAIIVLLVAFMVMRSVMSGLGIRRAEAGVPVQELMEQSEAESAAAAEKALPAEEEGETPISITQRQLEEIAHIAKDNPKIVAAWITGVTNVT